MMAQHWEDPDGIEKISREIESLVDDTARDAVVAFITGDDGYVMISSSLNVHFVDMDNQTMSKGEPLLKLIEEAIDIYESDISKAGPLPAMRAAYLEWKSRR